MLERVDAQVRIRHFCRNPHCRSKLAAPVDNKHHAFCTPGCHAVFYRSRCLVCEDPMRRKREEQRFKSGHNTCKKEYQRFPLVYDLLESILATTLAEIDSRHLETLDSSGSKVDPCAVLPRKMFWREKKGRGWYWEADLGEHRLFNRSCDLVARLNAREGEWVLTWPRIIPVQQADTAADGKRLAIATLSCGWQGCASDDSKMECCTAAF